MLEQAVYASTRAQRSHWSVNLACAAKFRLHRCGLNVLALRVRTPVHELVARVSSPGAVATRGVRELGPRACVAQSNPSASNAGRLWGLDKKDPGSTAIARNRSRETGVE